MRFEMYGDQFRAYYSDQVIHGNWNSMATTLRAKGNLFSRLIFSGNEMSAEQADSMSRLIEKYSANTLMELQLVDMHADHLIIATNRTFPNVKSFTLNRGIYPDQLRLHQIYPNLEALAIIPSDDKPIQSLHRHYSKLIHLTLNTDSFDNVNLRPLIELNGQLRSLKLNHMPSRNTLQYINDNLPELKTLNLQCESHACYRQDDHQAGTIHMDNVRHFIMRNGPSTPKRIRLRFEHLDSLEIDSDHLSDEIIRFIEENKHVKSLSLPSFVNPEDFERVVDVISKMPALEEITVAWWSSWDTLKMHRLFAEASSHKLKVVEIRSNYQYRRPYQSIPITWRLLNEKCIYFTSVVGVAQRFVPHN